MSISNVYVSLPRRRRLRLFTILSPLNCQRLRFHSLLAEDLNELYPFPRRRRACSHVAIDTYLSIHLVSSLHLSTVVVVLFPEISPWRGVSRTCSVSCVFCLVLMYRTRSVAVARDCLTTYTLPSH